MEREAKFRINDPAIFEQLQALRALAGYELIPLAAEQQHNIYYDTPDQRLQQQHYALRVRQTATRRVLTLKGENVFSNGTHEREELEADLGEAALEQGWPEGQLGEKLAGLLGVAPDLTALFSIDTNRRRILVGSQAQPVVELALDHSTLMAGTLRRSFYELEAELLEHGSEQDLQAVAEALQTTWSLEPEPQTKHERGLALLQSVASDSGGEPIELAPPSESVGSHPAKKKSKQHANITISADDDMAEAARKILAQQLRKLRKHEKDVRTSDDIEAVHQMRVATRRMRATLAVTQGVFKKRAIAPFGPMLRKLARALGAVRDRDVFLADLEDYRSRQDPTAQADLEALTARLQAEQQEAHATLVALLDSKKFGSAHRTLKRFVETPGLGAASIKVKQHAIAAHLVRHRVGSTIWRRYEELRAYELALPQATPETLHQLRIAGKWLRYVLELFEDALDGSRYKEVRGRLMELQDHMGLLQDAEVSLAYLQTFAAEQPSPGLSSYIADREQRRLALLADVTRVWGRVNSLTFRRRLADVITQL